MPEVLDMLLSALEADRKVYRVWATCSSVDKLALGPACSSRMGFVQEGQLARHARLPPPWDPNRKTACLYSRILRVSVLERLRVCVGSGKTFGEFRTLGAQLDARQCTPGAQGTHSAP